VLAVTLFVVVFFYVRIPLTFGTGLGLSLGALVAVVSFARMAQAARQTKES
jgi:hypothetical protein